ncbi:molybdopterin-synthase adenylyltransferase MoeB [Teredinibacter turnerae]|uniref:molybdopterin-synthase adenylyltransferase MoeB n=1 Tax=Teredinibacter turnerae TaxID=2426 RepID=UPI00041E9DD1|nr:molybdopterin-synthase adenylyltransferase MoeB [Teredinibacter turnerae]
MAKIIVPDRVAKIVKLDTNEFDVPAASTVEDALVAVCEQVDALKAHFFHPNGEFKNHFMLVINDEHGSLAQSVASDSTVEILLATSGGIDLTPAELSKEEVERYSRHLLLPNVGRKGQGRLKAARVLIIGTGGLGSPIALYLAAAGVGTLGLIDFDVVEESNLQRQIVHGHNTIGELKVESAKTRLLDINKHLNIQTHTCALSPDNAFDIITDYDLVIDGSDNFATRYLVNDACVLLEKPLVSGSIHQFDGQISVFNHDGGPCYRCVFPESPPAELAPNCSAGGVIGVLPGVVGTIQATEAVKILLDMGEPLAGKLLRFDALGMNFRSVKVKKDPHCKACGNKEAIKQFTYTPQTCSDSSSELTMLTEHHYIQTTDLAHMMQDPTLMQDAVLLDVRDMQELEICVLPEVINIPLGDLEDQLFRLDKSQTHYIICLAGRRAERAADLMLKHGFSKVYVLREGMVGWTRDIDTSMPIY